MQKFLKNFDQFVPIRELISINIFTFTYIKYPNKMEKVQQQEQKKLRTIRNRLLFTVPLLGSVKKVNSFINIKR